VVEEFPWGNPLPVQVLRPSFSGMSEEPTKSMEVLLLQGIAQGDQQAFAQFYDRFSGLLYSLAIRILNDPKEAEDVLQEVFLQIWAKASLFDPQAGKPSGWALTLTRNKAIDRLRTSQRRYRLLEQVTAQADPPTGAPGQVAEKIQADEKAALIRSVVAALPSEQRQAIELAFFGGFTQTEISERLKQPLGTIKARIRRGMLQLRESLGESL